MVTINETDEYIIEIEKLKNEVLELKYKIIELNKEIKELKDDVKYYGKKYYKERYISVVGNPLYE